MASKTVDNLTMTINIKLNAQNTVSVRVDPSWNVKRLKDEVTRVNNIPMDDVKIIFMGREVHDAMTIQHCDLGNNSVLYASRDKSITLEAQMEDMPPSIPHTSMVSIPDHYKSQFYVYCKSRCKAVQAGKIRVRCKRCQFGGFKVDRDPEGWDDVLEPNKITGKCTSENRDGSKCDGSIVEFFFKCKAHDTGERETSAPLNLIKPNPHNIPCITCYDEKNPIVVWPCDGQHCMCIDCFRDYGVAKMDERAFIQHKDVGYTLPCPAYECKDSYIKEPHHFHILGDAEYERYHNFGTEEFVLQAGGVLCPNKGCGAPILPEHNDRKIRCQCGYIFCRNCKEEFHNGECGQVLNLEPITSTVGTRFNVDRERAEQARWDQAAKDKIKETTRLCPKCRTPTEKNGGCMHMSCTVCKFHWCWICIKEWSRECQADHWFGEVPEARRERTPQQSCTCS